jgi:F420-dependent oxidoreductase-like protein
MAMELPRVGMDLVDKSSATGALAGVERAEARGVPMVWSTTGRGNPDPMTFFGAAAARTSNVGMGTAIVPTYPRHPAVMATQTVAMEQLAPGRFRLGIGTSHRPTIEGAYGLDMGKPLAHLREYLTVLRALLWDGQAEFSGDYFQVKSQINGAAQTPIYISALRANAFRLAGELADGAISWMCPLGFLRQTAAPAMRQGAERAGRATPRMVAHVPVVMSDDRDVMLSSARPRVSGYARQVFYANMFADAGFPVGSNADVSDDLLDHLVVWGDPGEVERRLGEALGEGIDELLVMLIPTERVDLMEEEARLTEVLLRVEAASSGGLANR